MKKSIGALLLILAGVLAACNGSNGSNTPPSGSGSNCGGPPSANQVQVLYPEPGATNVPPGIGAIYISSKGQLPSGNQYNLALVTSPSVQIGTSLFVGVSASKIPTPHATPSYSNPTYYASSLGPSVVLGPNLSVSVFWSIANACTPRTQISSFTTGP